MRSSNLPGRRSVVSRHPERTVQLGITLFRRVDQRAPGAHPLARAVSFVAGELAGRREDEHAAEADGGEYRRDGEERSRRKRNGKQDPRRRLQHQADAPYGSDDVVSIGTGRGVGDHLNATWRSKRRVLLRRALP